MKIFEEETILDMQVLKERSSTCYYSCGGISKQYNLCDFQKMNLDIFQMLFERKFNHGLGGYDFESVKSCCVPYNIRVALKNNTLKSKHLKKFKKHLQEIQARTSQQELDINSCVKLISEKLLQQSEKKNFTYSQISQVNKEAKIIVNHDVNQTLMKQLQKCQKQLEKVLNKNLNFEIESTALQLVLNQKKQCYYSNINKLLYIENFTNLENLEISEQKFHSLLLEAINNIEFQIYKITLNKFGNFTIQVQSELKNEIQKKQKIQKPIQQKPNKKQNNMQLKQVLFDGFTFDSFQIGNINVLIKDPSAKQEIFDFIDNYNIAIHGYNLGEYQIMKLFCKNHFPIQEVLEDKDKNVKIKLGLRQVEYIVNGKLIALGIIFLTKNYFISEYFTYDIAYGKGFGIFSMIVEIEYAKKIQEIFPSFNYYTPGYTVAIQPSMSYKLQFSGTQIQCPKTYQWIEYDDKLQQKLIFQPQVLCEENINMNALKDLTKVQLLVDGIKISAQQLSELHNSEQFIKNLDLYFELLGPELMSLIVFQVTPEFSLELDESLFYSIIDFLENKKPNNEFKSLYFQGVFD